MRQAKGPLGERASIGTETLHLRGGMTSNTRSPPFKA